MNIHQEALPCHMVKSNNCAYAYGWEDHTNSTPDLEDNATGLPPHVNFRACVKFDRVIRESIVTNLS